MDISVIVQSCDRYEKYWDGFFYYMEKFWDKNIKCPKYFCTENKEIKNKNFIQIKTGCVGFNNSLEIILKEIKTKYIFPGGNCLASTTFAISQPYVKN